MRVVIQRVLSANVSASDGRYAAIGPGLLVLLGIAPDDGDMDISWMTRKITALRIFNDPSGKMNLSLQETQGEVMVVSQFTLYADTARGASRLPHRSGCFRSRNHADANQFFTEAVSIFFR